MGARNAVEFDPDIVLRLRIEAFMTAYVHCIDDDRLEEWPDFFTDDCLYQVITRENHDLGLPVGVMYCAGKGMLRDRVIALRSANIYEPHTYRHLTAAVQLLGAAGGIYRTQSNFTVIRVMHSGETAVFCCGRYLDEIVEDGAALRLRKRTAVLDSRRVDTLLVIPI